MRRVKQIILLAILLTVFNVSAHAQCAMCRGTLESSVAGGDTTTASNLNIGILYLFVAPYILFGVLGYFWYRTSKRNGQKNKALSSIAG